MHSSPLSDFFNHPGLASQSGDFYHSNPLYEILMYSGTIRATSDFYHSNLLNAFFMSAQPPSQSFCDNLHLLSNPFQPIALLHWRDR